MEPRYHFVVDELNLSRLEQLKGIDPDQNPSLFWRGDLAWCLQSYLRLSRAGYPVGCGNDLADEAINIIHNMQLRRLRGSAGQFIVCARADFPACRWAQFQIVQNCTQLGRNSVYLPHWPQPGVRPRDPARAIVRRVAYSGLTYNGNMAGTVEQWTDLLTKEGFEFSVLTNQNAFDLREVDVMFALRSFDQRTHDFKPPSKLFNAWAANIPLIGGYDSAFSQIGTAGVDYARASTPEQVLAEMRRLRDEPGYYAGLVSRGAERFKQFNPTATTRLWWETLNGPIRERYQHWLKHPGSERIRRAAVLGWEWPIAGMKSIARRVMKR